ncbi:hypothetical protein, partial [Vibrio brasiliensis]
GTMRDRGGRVTGRWDRDRDRNRNTPATPPRNTPATPPRTKPKVKEEEVPKVEPTVIDDEEYANFKGGKFVPDDKLYETSLAPTQGRIETLEVDETVEQDLNVKTEKYSQGELMDTTVTDVVTLAGNEFTAATKNPVAILAAQAMEVALKSTETVKTIETQYRGVVYKVKSAPAVRFSNGDTYIKGEPVDTGRKVTHLKRVDKFYSEVNVREFKSSNPSSLGPILRK